ncbi:MFS transporter [Cohnella algarum]|uniref:MFS transporter n=1 Tax=Cohnella algarum TaxID=2044859 RepID=UPI0023DDFC78|nr:MFS transporter [Cohnella algarum]
MIYTLAFTMILSSMSATMFNIVLPKMAAEFQLTYAQVSWVSAIYSLIYAIGSAIYSKLADLIKLKSLVTFGILFFCIGSLIGLVSGAFWMVLLGRILQACGAAVIPAMAMIVPIRFFAERRGWALGITATGLAIGGTIGPVVSATLVSFAHWRWLFCLPLLLVVTLPFYRKYLNDEQGKGGKLDWIGGGLLACTVAGLLLTLTFENGLSAAMSAAALLLFVVRIHKATSPFVNPSLFRNVDYSLGLAIAVMGVSVGYCLLLLTPQLLADVHDLSPGLIGFIMVPGAAVSALLGRKAGKLADAKGNSTLLAIASVLLFVCFSLMYLFSLGGSPVLVAVFLIFGNVGLMFFQIALSNTISRTLPNEQTGIGMGLLSMLNFLSGAIATGIYSKIVDHGASFSLNPFVEEKNSYVYGNIYFVLTLAVLGIWIVYRVRFGSRTGERG